MKGLDIIILLAVIWFAIRGFRKGFFGELFSILAIVTGGWATVHFTDYTCSLLEWDNPNQWLLAAGIVFIAAVIAILLIGKLFKSAFNFVMPDFFDKLLGLLFGGGKVILLVGILFYFISHSDMQEKILTADRKSSSYFYAPSLKVADFLLPQFKKLKECEFIFEKKKLEDD